MTKHWRKIYISQFQHAKPDHNCRCFKNRSQCIGVLTLIFATDNVWSTIPPVRPSLWRLAACRSCRICFPESSSQRLMTRAVNKIAHVPSKALALDDSRFTTAPNNVTLVQNEHKTRGQRDLWQTRFETPTASTSSMLRIQFRMFSNDFSFVMSYTSMMPWKEKLVHGTGIASNTAQLPHDFSRKLCIYATVMYISLQLVVNWWTFHLLINLIPFLTQPFHFTMGFRLSYASFFVFLSTRSDLCQYLIRELRSPAKHLEDAFTDHSTSVICRCDRSEAFLPCCVPANTQATPLYFFLREDTSMWERNWDQPPLPHDLRWDRETFLRRSKTSRRRHSLRATQKQQNNGSFK